MTVTQPPYVPAPNPILGHLQDARKDIIQHQWDMYKQGDIVRVRYGPVTSVYVNHPDLIQEFLVKQSKNFRKDDILKRAFRSYTGESIFTSDDEVWRKQRKLMQPAFHSQRIGNYADDIVNLTQDTISNWNHGDVVDIKEIIPDLTSKIILKTMFGMEDDSHYQMISDALNQFFQFAAEDVTASSSPPMWLPTPRNQKIKTVMATLKTLYQEVIDEWRKIGEDRGDLLSMLMLAQYDDGSTMSDDQIMSELNTIFIAGHETTANTIIFALTTLSDYPDIVDKLRAELSTVLEDCPAKLTDLKSLTYSAQIIKETQRLFPSALGVGRVSSDNVEIGGNHISKGSLVVTTIYGLHRDGAIYPNPLTFDPDRWTPEFEEQLHRYAYIPFGAGPRICLGNQFAIMEMQLILATLYQHCTLTLHGGVKVTPSYNFTLNPGADQVLMDVHR